MPTKRTSTSPNLQNSPAPTGKRGKAIRRAMLADDKDPDVPKLRKVLGELQKLVRDEEVTPELANRVLGNYADDLRNPRRKTQGHRRATVGPLAKLKLPR